MYWEDYSDSLLKKCKELHVPYFACFELTPFCNLNCNMCYIRLTPDQAAAQGRLLTTDEWLQIGEEARRMGVVSLEVTGGEPTTRKDFPILYEAFAKMGFLIKLRTNGYYLSKDNLELLGTYNPYEISITLYGASNDTYKRVCQVPNGFTRVIDNINALENSGIAPRLTMTITKENAADVPKIKNWASETMHRVHTFGGLMTPIRGARRNIDHLRLTYSDEDCDVPVETIEAHEVVNRGRYMNPFWMCRGFGAEFNISWDGRMTLCNGLTKIWSEPLSSGLVNAFNELNNKLLEVKRPIECVNCNLVEYCGACPSRLLSATDSCERTCDAICRTARRNFKYHVLKGLETNDCD